MRPASRRLGCHTLAITLELRQHDQDQDQDQELVFRDAISGEALLTDAEAARDELQAIQAELRQLKKSLSEGD